MTPPLATRLLDLRPGDLPRVLPLVAYHFVIIAFYMMGRVARDAIFLDHFTAAQLPFADVAAAACAGGLVAVYLRAGRRASVRRLQIGSLACVALGLVLLWAGTHVEHWAWCAAVLYVWVGLCGVLTVTQVWTLASIVWTTREAKRLFGLLGSGGIVGGIAGGFLAKAIAHTLGTDAMLLVMAAALVPCAVLVNVIWVRRPPAVAGGAPPAALGMAPDSLLSSFRRVRQSPHLRTIAVLICLASVVTTIVSWQLKAIAKDTLVQKDALAAYLGAFTGYTGAAALAVQLLITTRLLRRFGVGIALLVLPFFLTVGSIAVGLSGALWAATLLKGSDGIFRYSIDSSAVQLLYLPVAGAVKLQVKSFLDTFVWKVGDGLAGLTLLLFATVWRFSPRQISWVTLALLAGWFATALVARRRYVTMLGENIRRVGMPSDGGPVTALDRFTTEVFADKLNSSDPADVLYALTLFEMGQRLQSHGAVRHLLAHPAAEVRRKAIAILGEAGDLSVRDEIIALLRDEDLDVRTEALRYLTRHERLDPLLHIDDLTGFGGASIRSATVAFLARPGDGQNLEAARLLLDRMIAEHGADGRQVRAEAARIVAVVADGIEDRLATLLDDEEPDVVRAALASAAGLRPLYLAPAVIDRLGDATLEGDAAGALVSFGDAVVGPLGARLIDPEAAMAVRRKIPSVLLRIGTPAAGHALADAMLEADLALRYHIIVALNKLCERTRHLPLDLQQINTVMMAELMGHYRSYQILGTLGGEPDAVLQASMAHELERIFRLLKLLFPSIDLQAAHAAVQSADPVIHGHGLEFLENTLNPRLRALLVPLIDSDVSVEERARLADRFLGFAMPAPHLQ